MKALCRVPAVFESCGATTVIDDPTRPLSTLPVSFYPKGKVVSDLVAGSCLGPVTFACAAHGCPCCSGAVLPHTPFVDVDLTARCNEAPLRDVLVSREIELVKNTEADSSFPASAESMPRVGSASSAQAYPYYDRQNHICVAPGARIEPGIQSMAKATQGYVRCV